MNLTKINLNDSKISPLLAEICGIHAGDGYLRNKDWRKEWDISGNIEEKEYYDQHMIPLFNKVFKLSIKGRFFPYRNTYGFVIRDRKIIEFAHKILGFPCGSKSTKIKVPKFVLKNISLIRNFLRGYFDTDGHFSCMKRTRGKYVDFKRKFHYYPRMKFNTVSSQLSDDLRIMLESLQIKFYSYNYQPLTKTESLKYIYDINGPEQVKKLIWLIKPKNTTKTSRYLIWKKFGFCPTNITYKQRQDILKGEIDPHIFYRGL